FQVECSQRNFRATSAGASLADATAKVFWSPSSCLTASFQIEVLPPPDEAAEPIQEFDPATSEMLEVAPPVEPILLTRIYEGPEGFARLIEDFAGGSRAFGIGDFRDSYSPAQWSELRQQLAEARFRSARVFLQ